MRHATPGAAVFCSACGSRSGHKTQLEERCDCLWKQVQILKEITRHQADDLQDLRRVTVATDLQVGSTSRMGDVEALKAEVQRLRAELRVWQSTEGLQGHYATNSCFAGGTSVDASKPILRSQQMASEADGWKAEKDELASALKEQRNKVSQILRALADEGTTSLQESKRLAEEVDRWRSKAQLLRRQREVTPTATEPVTDVSARRESEDLQLLQKRLEVEHELKAAQEAQLESLRETLTAMRRQVYQATRENTELRQTLASQQEILQQLQQPLQPAKSLQ